MLLFTATSQACGLGVLLIVARCLPTDSLGIFLFALNLQGYLMLIGSAGAASGVIREIGRDPERAHIYVVQVRDTNFGGGDSNCYVLHVGTFVRPAAVFPAGGQAATEAQIKLLGDAEELTQTVKLPGTGGPFEFYPTDGSTPPAPTPNPFRVSPFPNVIEVEQNDDPKQGNRPVPWPVAFNGIIEKPGDTDHFRFVAKRGDQIDVQAFAYRIGSPLDTVIAVLDARGELLASNDDDETHDSRLQLPIPEDGEYVVRIIDKRKQGGPRYIYRVELSRPEPSLAVFFPAFARKTQDRQVITIPRGNRVVANIAVRRDGFTGPVAVVPGDLPAGVTVSIPPIAAGDYVVPVVFEAGADAPLAGKFVALTGTAGNVKGGFSQVVTLTAAPGDAAFHSVELAKLAVVVTEEAPFSVSIARPAVSLVPDSTLDVAVKVTRAKDFSEPIEVFFPCLPPGVEAPTSIVIPVGKSDAVVTLVGHPTAELGDWRFVVEAKVAGPGRAGREPLTVGMNGLGTPGGDGRQPRRRSEGLPPVASEVISMKVSQSALVGTFAPATGEQGKAVKEVCRLAAPTPAGSEFTAKLDGLPPRATALPVEVKPGTTEIVFLVTIDATTSPGDYRSLVCELAGTVSGEKVVYRLGRGASLKVNAPGAAKTDATGKPLSPLDVLRLELNK